MLATALGCLAIIAGWHYLAHSRCARDLSTIESSAINARRNRLRRVGGAAMALLGLLLLFGYHADRLEPLTELVIWLTVLLLLAAILTLAAIDLRLTLAVRRSETGPRSAWSRS